MEKGYGLGAIIVVSLIVAVLVSAAAVTITSNVIKVRGQAVSGYDIYTKAEIDGKLSSLKGSCQYVDYKDDALTSLGTNINVMKICKKLFGFLPKIIIETEEEFLYNAAQCGSSYQIFSSRSDRLISYKTELAGVILGSEILKTCEDAKFPDGKFNGFSQESYRFYSGVLCCNN